MERRRTINVNRSPAKPKAPIAANYQGILAVVAVSSRAAVCEIALCSACSRYAIPDLILNASRCLPLQPIANQNERCLVEGSIVT
jgi:hypothetical protein